MKEITIKSEINNVSVVTQMVEEYLEEHDVSPKVIVQFNIAIDELFSNICYYAYKEPGDVTVAVDITDEPRAVELVFCDGGIPYNPLEKEDPDVTLSAEERQIGGLGIFMVKKSMDQMIYSYEDGKNILRLVKNLFCG